MNSSQPATTLARLSELLATIDASAAALRTYLQQEQTGERRPDDDAAAAYSANVSSTLGLPFHAEPGVARQAAILRIACERLAQLVTPPRHRVLETACSFYDTLALQIVSKARIATLIDRAEAEAGREGVPIELLSRQSALDVDLLTRLLRHLSLLGIFQELSPNTFSNTVASATMVDNPEFNAHLDLAMHEGQIAAPFFPDLVSKRFAASQQQEQHSSSGSESGEHIPQPLSAFALYSDGQPFYSWLHSPANADRGKNFNMAMHGLKYTEGLAFLPVDYPFSALPTDQLIVDIGGGMGSLPALLLPSVPHLRFVVQDLAPVVAQAQDAAGPDMKRWIEQGRLRFEVQDCFLPQAADKDGAIFVLKNMVHNYPDSKALQLLATIRKSNPSRLLVMDQLIVPHLRMQGATPAAESDIYRELRGHVHDQRDDRAEPPHDDDKVALVPKSQRISMFYDLVMASLHGGRTRTIGEWRALLSRAGFRVDSVHPLRASTGQAVLDASMV